MTDEKNETWADIVAEMRECKGHRAYYDGGLHHESREEDVIDVDILHDFADRFEAAAKREIPQPDPDWKDICAKCMDGDIEPDCKYYGEPNGCNSPIYGEHPKAKPVCNAAAIREVLNKVGNICLYVKENCAEMDTAKYMAEAIDSIKAALTDPPRNCDVGTAEEQEQRYLKLKKEHVDRLTFCPHVGYAAFFPDSLYWAQMPYEVAQEGDNNGSKQ